MAATARKLSGRPGDNYPPLLSAAALFISAALAFPGLAYQAFGRPMRLRNYSLIATLSVMACGSNEKVQTDTAAPDAVVIDAAVPSEAQAPAEVAMDSTPGMDWAEPDTLSLDTVETVDTAVDVGSVAPVVCDPAVLGSNPPSSLSQTGCFETGEPGHPIAAFFPYEVNSPLWSDGAVKSRFFRIPAGQTIKVKDCDQEPALCLPVNEGGTPEDEGHFELPVGSILIKNFALQGKLIETRMLIHVSDTVWNGLSYEWNDDGIEATLLSDFKDRAVAGQTWHYPSPRECLQCHTAAAGRTLGPTTRQLDRVTSDGNQLDRLVGLGWLPARPKALAPYPDPRKDGPVAERARAYLQSNCSFCHRPAGPFSDMDLRYGTALFAMNVCNVSTVRGIVDVNVPPLRLVPGAPERSALSVRMHNRSGYAMPKIGSNLVDSDGVAVVDAWIRATTECPLAPSD